MAQTRRVELAVPADQAYERVLAAFEAVGKVEESSALTRSMRGRMQPYGWGQWVATRVSVLTGPSATASLVEIETRSTDMLGTSQRKAADKLIGALG